MNLEDIIDPNYGLQQDEYTLSNITFGKDQQLKLIGWSGRDKCHIKLYVAQCSVCSNDTELFGGGIFRTRKSHIKAGKVPCGCSAKPEWSRSQWEVLCTRNARKIGVEFIGFSGQWLASKTRVNSLCFKHGQWNSGTILSLYNGNGCPECRTDATKLSNTKPDEVMIASFMSTGGFSEGTSFWRSDRKDSRGIRSYWFMHCPDCGEVIESYCGCLSIGQRGCGCNRNNQKSAYINLLSDPESGHTIALKFGVTNRSNLRVKQQNYMSTYTVSNHCTYEFTSARECKKAERDCKQELECGVVLKRDMKDGYTETTWAYNLEKIVEIYERNGGVRVD